jgi:hypothetical protein
VRPADSLPDDALRSLHDALRPLHAWPPARPRAQVALWLERFDRERFVFVEQSQLKGAGNAQAQLQRVFSFLGLPPHDLVDASPKNERASR